jgi:ABC-2 type transport system permease protein
MRKNKNIRIITETIEYLANCKRKFLGFAFNCVLFQLIYVAVISSLGMPEGNIDMGSTIGSYFGLLFLIAAYSAIGIFTSTLSDNQIVAFIVAVFLCFFFYFGFEGLATVVPNMSSIFIRNARSFQGMSRGVLDRDILYFTSITVVFLSFTVYKLKSFKS